MAKVKMNLQMCARQFVGEEIEELPGISNKVLQANNDNLVSMFDEIRQVLPNRKGFEEAQENVSKYFADPNTGEIINQPLLKIKNKNDIKDFFKKKRNKEGKKRRKPAKKRFAFPQKQGVLLRKRIVNEKI